MGSMEVCTECRSWKVLTDYRMNTVTKDNRTTKVYCQKCLTKYAEASNYNGYKNIKLTDTNIDKYNEAINDYRFIPLAQRMSINEQTGEVMFNQLY